MRGRQMLYPEHSIYSRILAVWLSIIMMLTSLPGSLMEVFAEDDAQPADGGFSISMSWNNIDGSNDVDTSQYDPAKFFSYHSSSYETRQVRLKISYKSNGTLKTGIDAGKLAITVPGLKDAFRAGNEGSYRLASISADEESAENKTYDYSYSYSAGSDTYTFTNNKAIAPKYSFEGSFELIWSIPSRLTIKEFSKTLTAELFSEGIYAQSNTVEYYQYREPDKYTLELEAFQLFKDDMPDNALKWVRYDLSGTDTYLARDVNSSNSKEKGERFELYFLAGADVQGAGLIKDFGKSGREINGKLYDCWYVWKNIDPNTKNPYLNNIFVGYPASVDTSEYVTAYAELYGTYYDEFEESLLAETLKAIRIIDFNYNDNPGDVYDAYKLSYGMHNKTIDQVFDAEHDPLFRGAINAKHLTNGGGDEYRSNLMLEFNYENMGNRVKEQSVSEAVANIEESESDEDHSDDEEGESDDEPPSGTADEQTVEQIAVQSDDEASESEEPEREYIYDFEFVDDILQIELENGDFRKLDEEEYHFTKVVIPSAGEIKNSNNMAIKSNKYGVEIYYRRKGEEFDPFGYFPHKLIDSNDNIKIINVEQTFEIPDDDAVAVQVFITNVTESIATPPWYGEAPGVSVYNFQTLAKCYYQFNVKDIENVKVDGGRLVNNMFFRLYRYHEGTTALADKEWANNSFTPENYEDADEVMQWDYDHYAQFNIGKDDEGNDIPLYVDREKDVTPILEIPSMFKMATPEITKGTEEQHIFNFNGSMKSEFEIGEDSALYGFTMYTVLPEGFRLSEAYNDPDRLMNVLNFSANNLSSAYLAARAKITIVDDPEQYNGRQKISIHFDFNDNPLTDIGYVKVDNLPMYQKKDGLNYGIKSIKFRTAMLVDEDGQKWTSNSTDNHTEEDGVWYDLDGDTDVTEKASFAETSYSYVHAEATKVELTKLVSTPLTNGMVQPNGDTELEKVPKTYVGGDYSYYLRVGIGEMEVNRLLFADTIEPKGLEGYTSDWQGTFVSVDTDSVLKKLKAPAGEALDTPVIYYSEKEVDFSQYAETDDSGMKKINIREILKENLYEWATVQPAEVRSILVDFGNGILSSNSEVTLEIKMKAPDTDEYINQIARNKGYVDYDKRSRDTGDVLEHQSLESDIVPVTYVAKGQITLIKQDEVDHLPLANAKFDLYRVGNDNPIGTYTTNKNGRFTVTDLSYGDYYFKEVTAPRGYILPEDEEARITETITVSDKVPSVIITADNKRKPGKVTVIKVSDRLPDLTLEGVEFDLYRADGTKYRENLKTDNTGTLVIENLEWGNYYLLETKAPDGYEILEDRTDFTIDIEHGVEVKLELTVTNQQKPGMVQLIKYELPENHEYDTLNGKNVYTENETDKYNKNNPVSGAVYDLYMQVDGGEDKLITSRVTDSTGSIYIDDLTFGKYYFVESSSAVGYEKYNQHLEFVVNAENTKAYVPVITADSRTTGRVYLQKLDDSGKNNIPSKPVENAVYGLFDKNGNRIFVSEGANPGHYTYPGGSVQDMKTNSEGVIEITGLHWGEYYIQEVKAPTGYILNLTKYPFDLNVRTVSQQVIINTDDETLKGSVKLIKMDEEEKNVLPGAVFTLYRSNGTIYKENITTGSDGTVTVNDLEWGSYYFLETKAPSGYSLNPQTIRFSVSNLTAGKTQELIVTDPKARYALTVTKKILVSDIQYVHGNPTFMFKVKGNDHTYHKAVTFDQEYVETHTDKDGYVRASVIFSLEKGQYTVSEMKTNRYKLIGITANPADKAEIKEDTAIVKLGADTGEVPEIEIIFENEKNRQKGTSDTDLVTNVLHRARKMTAISAVYDGNKVISDEASQAAFWKNLEKNLKVYAVYDDDSTVEIKYGDYQIEPVDFSELSGNYNVKVTYTDGKKTYSDTFEIIVTGNDVFLWEIIEDETFIEKGIEYAGKIMIYGYKGTSSVINFPSILVEMDDDGNELYYKVVKIGNGSRFCDVNGEPYAKLSTITFAEGIEIIDDYAFSNSYQLLLPNLRCELKLPSTIKSIGNYAFNYSNIYGDLVLPESLTYLGNSAFATSKITGVTFNSKLKDTGNYTFQNCSLERIVFVEGLERIGRSVFSPPMPKPSEIEVDVTIPSTVTEIDEYAFEFLSFSGDLIFAERDEEHKNAEGLKINNSAFQKTSFTTLTLPSHCIEVGNNAFYTDRSAYTPTYTSLVFSEGTEGSKLEIIGDSAFYNMTAATNTLTIPSSVKSIGASAFANTGFTRLEFKFDDEETQSSSLTTIGAAAFNSMPNAYGDVIIPSSVESIGNYAFNNFAMEYVQYKGYVPHGGSLTVGGNKLKTITQPMLQGGGFTGTLTIRDGVQILADNAFRSASFSGTLTIPDSVTEIGTQAFYMCTALDYIKLGKNIKTIGNNAFQQCRLDNGSNGMKGDIIISDSVESIGAYAFGSDTFLGPEIIIGRNPKLTTIEDGTFYNCEKATAIYIPLNITTLNGTSVFSNIYRTTTVYAPTWLESAIKSCSYFSGNIVTYSNYEDLIQNKLNGYDPWEKTKVDTSSYSIYLPESAPVIEVPETIEAPAEEIPQEENMDKKLEEPINIEEPEYPEDPSDEDPDPIDETETTDIAEETEDSPTP